MIKATELIVRNATVSFPMATTTANAMEEFLKEFGEYYGYRNAPKTIDQIRATEFNRLQGSFY